MGKYFLGAISSSDRETRILKLKAYLNTVANYRSDDALNKANVTSWTTFIKYLHEIAANYQLTIQGKTNLTIALREAQYLQQAQQKQKRSRK